jgi:hypothetical protein
VRVEERDRGVFLGEATESADRAVEHAGGRLAAAPEVDLDEVGDRLAIVGGQ